MSRSAQPHQIALALVLLELPFATAAFVQLNRVVFALQRATEAGSSFVFGYLGGGPLPYEETRAGASIVFAFRFLPLVIVVSALAALLTYWRVLPAIVRAFAALLRAPAQGIGGAVAVSAAANVFLGMIESPILVRPYIERLTRSELFIVMCRWSRRRHRNGDRPSSPCSRTPFRMQPVTC